MRIFRNPELKGILALTGFIAVLGFALLVVTGTIVIHTPWSKRITDKIIFASTRNGQSDIWIMNPDGSGQKPMTNDANVETNPVISPDGYRIAYLSRRGNDHNQVYMMDPDGTHQYRISNITGTKSDLKFSPDGKRLMFLCNGEIWSIGINDKHADRLLPTVKEIAASRTEGSKTAYHWGSLSFINGILAGIKTIGEAQTVVLLGKADKDPVPVAQQTEKGMIPILAEKIHACWNPREDKLALSLISPEGAGAIAAVDPSDGSVQIMPQGGALGKVAWSPDGSSIAAEVVKRAGPGDYEPIALLLLDPSIGQPKILKLPASDPKWSPDGTKVAFTSRDDVYIVDISSGKIVNLTKGKGSSSQPDWAPVSK